jgi:hypothetical protein
MGLPGSWRTRPTACRQLPSRTAAAGHSPIMQGNRGISATPCATAHGAHSGTSTSPPRSVGSRRVITARLSHIPRSSGCDLAQTHSQSRWPQTRVVRQDSSTARMAGSLESLWNASLVMAAVCSAHSVTTAVAASQAAANCRNGLFSPLMTTSSHLERVVGNRIMLVHPSSCPSPRPDPLPILQALLWPGHGLAGHGLAGHGLAGEDGTQLHVTSSGYRSRVATRSHRWAGVEYAASSRIPHHLNPLRVRCTSCGGLSEMTPETGGTRSCGQPLPQAHW